MADVQKTKSSSSKKSSKDRSRSKSPSKSKKGKGKSKSRSRSRSKDKKKSSKQPALSGSQSAEQIPIQTPPPPLTPQPSQPSLEASDDFEAGALFNKYDPLRTGALTAAAFREMFRELNMKSSSQSNGNKQPISSAFDAGAIFAKYDVDQDGKLSKKDFEELILSHPELLQTPAVKEPIREPIIPAPSRESPSSNYRLPHEVISGKLLTHYDETAGVAIPKSSVLSHEQLGNTVRPLVQAYNTRYEHLRTMLTSKLLPRRETILQLRRQLTTISSELEAAKSAIERETMADVEKIIERLRNAESMKQSSIQHQILQLDAELEQIETLIERIEIANQRNSYNTSNGITITSATSGNLTPFQQQLLQSSSTSSKHVNWAFDDLHNPTAPPQISSLLQNDALTISPRADLMLELIQQYTNLAESINKLSNKQLVVQLNYNVNDFPKEISERLEIISKYDKYRQALEVKDHMLWLAMQDKEKFEEEALHEKKLCAEYLEEIHNWVEMANHLKIENNELQQNNDRLEKENNYLINLLREHGIHYTR